MARGTGERKKTELDPGAAEAAIEAICRAELDMSETEDSEPPAIILHHPLHYVIDTWFEHRQHGNYPNAGGYNDQDAQLIDDWRQVTGYYNWVYRQLQADKKDQRAFDSLIEGGDSESADGWFS